MRRVHWVSDMESVDISRFFRRMHMDRTCEADRVIRERVYALMEEVGFSFKMQGVWIAEEEVSLGVPEIDRCHWKILALCYASEEVQAHIKARMEAEEYLEAYLLDQLANEKIYQISEQMNQDIYNIMKKEDCHLTRVYYPGEGEICLKRQAEYLPMFGENVPSEVTVSAGGMLQPEKAMLYVLGADEAETDKNIGHDCKNCARTQCSYRLEE